MDEDGACGTSEYPVAPTDAASVLHVSAACSAEGADGSAARPYATISKALTKASPGTALLIAPGTYAEHLRIDKSVQLIGSSAPDDPAAARVVIAPSDAPFENCEGVRTSTAVVICGAEGVLLRGLSITDAVAAGLKLSGGSATIEGSRVENTALEDGQFGHGIIATSSGSIILQHSEVVGAAGVGVYVTGAGAIILQNTIRDGSGPGIRVDLATARVQIERNTIENNTQIGVGVFSSQAIILQNEIRGTRLDQNGIGDGIIAGALRDETDAVPGPASVEVDENEISAHGRVGALFAAGTRAIILQRNTIGGNAALASFGAGVWLQGDAGDDPSTAIRDNGLTENRFVGIGIRGTARGIILQNNSIEATALASTFSGVAQVEIGDGIGLFAGAAARIEGNTFRRNGRLGLILDEADGRDTAIENNTFVEQAAGAIILQNVAVTPQTDTNTFDGPNSVQIVAAGTFGIRAEEFATR